MVDSYILFSTYSLAPLELAGIMWLAFVGDLLGELKFLDLLYY